MISKLPGSKFLVCSALVVLAGCSTSFLKYEKTEELNTNKEFESAVKVEKVEEAPVEKAATPAEGVPAAPVQSAQTATVTPKKTKAQIKAEKKAAAAAAATAAAAKKEMNAKKKGAAVDKAAETPAARQPDIEDSVGFVGRRPIKDPFRVGEEVVHDVHYFKVSAGELRLKVDPFVMVNGRKAYQFAIAIKTVGVFSNFYSVDDKVETYVDYENLLPSTYELHVKETDQLREAKMFFDQKKNTATFWEKKFTKKNGEEEKKLSWEIAEYSQNVFSAAYYMRVFQWEVGKEFAFRVASDEENLVFTAKALRKEVLDTKIGPKNAIVIQPQMKLKGNFKPIGDIFIWLSDDEYKHILRIESKIKIGTLISEVISIK